MVVVNAGYRGQFRPIKLMLFLFGVLSIQFGVTGFTFADRHCASALDYYFQARAIVSTAIPDLGQRLIKSAGIVSGRY